MSSLSPAFVSIQLALVDRFVELGQGPLADGIHRLTNFHRRLGLGSPTDPPSDPTWVQLLEALAAAPNTDTRAELVVDLARSLPPAEPTHVVQAWPTVGAFSVEVDGDIARTHFFSLDNDDLSPLHPTKLERRKAELREAVALALDASPQVERILGGSWLYNTRSYSSLFPAAHIAAAQVRQGRSTFRGMSHWGQFLDHRGAIRAQLAEEFRQRLESWAGDDPCALFPISTLEVDSPVAVFTDGW